MDSLQKIAQEFYKKVGIILRKKSTNPNDIIVFSDYFIQIFIPEKLKEQIKKCLNKEENFKLLNILDKSNEKIKVIIHKDKELSEEVKNNLLKQYFKSPQ